jgi:hypothetical protein
MTFRRHRVAILACTLADGDHGGMDMTLTVAFVLIGLGAFSAGMAGLALPAGERIAAVLTLVVGAGIGVITLAIGTQVVSNDPSSLEEVFLTASALGLVATLGSLTLLWRWIQRERGRTGRSGDRPTD